jgi:hypothetical protein
MLVVSAENLDQEGKMKPIKFADLPTGAYFRWQTSKGGGITFLKATEEIILPADPGRRRLKIAHCYFCGDRVRTVKP